VYAHLALGETLLYLGELLSVRKHLEMAISLYDRERHLPMIFRYYGLDAGVWCLSLIARCLWDLGYPDEALTKIDEAFTLAQGLSHPHSLAFAELYASAVHQSRREVRATQEMAEALIALSAEHRITGFLPFATVPRGWAMAQQGRHEEGIVQIKEGLAGIRAIGSEVSWPGYLCLLAEACMEAGQIDDGLNVLTEALAAADEHENRKNEAEIHRLRGELLLRQDQSNAPEAQRCFERAIEIARIQSAKSLELLARMRLARLLAQQGRREEARAMLAEIYNWFTEGFDTADLKEAKTLLDELNG
jgi:predicted ATPase